MIFSSVFQTFFSSSRQNFSLFRIQFFILFLFSCDSHFILFFAFLHYFSCCYDSFTVLSDTSFVRFHFLQLQPELKLKRGCFFRFVSIFVYISFVRFTLHTHTQKGLDCKFFRGKCFADDWTYSFHFIFFVRSFVRVCFSHSIQIVLHITHCIVNKRNETKRKVLNFVSEFLSNTEIIYVFISGFWFCHCRVCAKVWAFYSQCLFLLEKIKQMKTMRKRERRKEEQKENAANRSQIVLWF